MAGPPRIGVDAYTHKRERMGTVELLRLVEVINLLKGSPEASFESFRRGHRPFSLEHLASGSVPG